MLIKILKRLAKGGIYSNKLVAKELGVDESLVEQMIEQLKSLNYIEKDTMDTCSSGCGTCSKKCGCCGDSSNIDLVMWKLTDKGRKAILR